MGILGVPLGHREYSSGPKVVLPIVKRVLLHWAVCRSDSRGRNVLNWARGVFEALPGFRISIWGS